MKIDFSRVTFHPTIEGEPDIKDQRKELSEALYATAKDLPTHILAMKIYNSRGEDEYTEDEVKLIRDFVDALAAPYWLKKGFYELLDKG